MFFFQAKDIFKIHSDRCPQQDKNVVQISTDGVRESKSSLVSIDVYSSRFLGCRNVYPHRIVRPLGKYKGIDNHEQLEKFINDIRNSDKIIDKLIADNPKRAMSKVVLCHSATFPCEYCNARGISIQIKNIGDSENIDLQIQLVEDRLQNIEEESEKENLNSLKKKLLTRKRAISKGKKKITWPASTANSELRNREQIIDIVNNVDSLSPEERKGIVGKSVLLDIPGFDYIKDAPAEYLHSVCLGNVKKLCELTFSVSETSRPRVTKRKLSKPSAFNALMAKIKTPHEFPRRARDLDFSVLKGAEFRNLAIFYFPLIIDCIEDGQDERNLWLYIAYTVRACVLPTDEFELVDVKDVKDCCDKYYQLFEDIMGMENCSYSLHVVFSHIMEIRANEPLPNTSAFGFESFYGEMRHSFVPGTISPLKQIFTKILLKRSLSKHICETPIFFANYNTALENNTMIYCFEKKEHRFYIINEIIDDDHFLCKEIGKYPHVFPEVPHLNWSKVGVYEKGGIGPEQVIIEKKNVSGKLLEVQNLLITCPNLILREK